MNEALPAPLPTQVVIADRHRLVRAGLARILDAQPWLRIIGEASTGTELIEQHARLQPEVVLIDLYLPDGALDATRAIHSAAPSTAVVILADCEDADALMATLQAGAIAYVLKDTEPDELVRTIRQVVDGKVVVPPSLAAEMLRRMAMRPGAGVPRAPTPLTERELGVLRLISEGKSNREIAEDLFCAVGTVKIHVEHILAKLGATDRTTAAVRASEMGLVGHHHDETGPASGMSQAPDRRRAPESDSVSRIEVGVESVRRR